MKSEFRRILSLALLAGLLNGCESDPHAHPIQSTSGTVAAHPELDEANSTRENPSKISPLTPGEQRQALGNILSTLDKAREQAGLDENTSAPSFGSLTYSNGGKYVGGFKDGKRHGLGSFVFANGDYFRGYYVNGRRQGYGVYEFTSGERYEGYFHAGKYHHWGLYLFKNGDKYFGQYQRGKRNGTGTLSKKSGERYEGDFADGKRQGFGACVFADGSRYSGTWKNDEPEGWGTYVHPGQAKPPSSGIGDLSANAGDRFSQAIPTPLPSHELVSAESILDLRAAASPLPPTEENLAPIPSIDPLQANPSASSEVSKQFNQSESVEKDGFLDFDNGDRYAGQLMAGQPHGQGAYLFANGERYLGDFRRGDYHGQGLFTFADGSRYLGQWSGGRFHGRGILYTPDGKVERDGFWSAGVPSE